MVLTFLLAYALISRLTFGGSYDYAPSNLTSNAWTPISSPPEWLRSHLPAAQPEPGPPGEAAPEALKHYYNGPIKLYRLADSLQALPRIRGDQEQNRNVLFASASLKSAAVMIPIACEMARWRRNQVHLTFMGRDDLPLKDILTVNGVDKACGVTWHGASTLLSSPHADARPDARPDFAQYSTELRLQVSVQGAMYHMNEYVHPQAVIIDASGREERIFTEALREKLQDLGRTIIELPENAAESLMWLTRLDHGSLRGEGPRPGTVTDG